MEEQILAEIKEMKLLLAKLIGSSELSEKERFSPEILDKAATQYRKLATERGERICGPCL